MRRQRGFTLIEVAIVIALIAIVTGMAIVGLRAARRNASVGAESFELVLKLQGLKTKALAEQRDHLAVLVAGDGGACRMLRSEGCVRLFVLAAPTAAWTLDGFDPASPGAELDPDAGEVVDRIVLPTGVNLHDATPDGMVGKPPFDNVWAWDAELDGTCDGLHCVAFRFGTDGEVRGETRDGTVLRKAGNIVALATDLEGQTGAAERRAVLVSFPSGIVKSYTY
jgi:prepilin-type N-terminal cleavage/methylation domain-containing protein